MSARPVAAGRRSGPAGAPGAEAGLATVQYVVASALSLVFLVLVANLVVVAYARGAVRAALDEAARAGAPAGLTDAEAEGACRREAAEVLDGLLGGPMGEGVEVRCRVSEGVVRAETSVTFRPWLPGSMPDWTLRATARARREGRG